MSIADWAAARDADGRWPVPKGNRMTDSEIAVANIERELCKRDVCMYCGGRAPSWKKIPEGPNKAGNYVHRSKLDRRENDEVLCIASAIFAREKYENYVRSEKP
jgi:hypothetical protein